MSLLIKTALKNIYKNKSSVFILFFFVTSGSTVFLSGETLKENIDSSITPFKSPADTSHDFVVSIANSHGMPSSTVFDNTITTTPTFVNDWNQIDTAASLAWKWTMLGNTGSPWVKIVSRSGSASSWTYVTDRFEHELKPTRFIFPTIHAQADRVEYFRSPHHALQCPMDQNNLFIQKIVTPSSPNNAYFFNNGKDAFKKNPYVDVFPQAWNKNFLEGEPLMAKCSSNGWAAPATQYNSVFNDLLRLFYLQTQGSEYGHDIGSYMKSDWTKTADGTTTAYFKLTAEEEEQLRTSKYSKTWWGRNLKILNSNPSSKKLQISYFPFFTKDHYLNFKLKFSNLLKNGQDINERWKKIIKEIRDGPVYANLSEELKNIVDNNVEKLNLLEDFHIPYFLSNFEESSKQDLLLSRLFLPALPSITWQQQLFLLHKLLMWDWLSTYKNESVNNKEAEFTNTSKTFANYFRDIQKNNFAKLKNLISGLKSFAPSKTKVTKADEKKEALAIINDADKTLKYGSLYDHMFANISNITEAFSTLQGTYASKKHDLKYEKYENYSSSGGPNATLTAPNEANRLLDVLLQSWEDWIDNKFYSPQDLGLDHHLKLPENTSTSLSLSSDASSKKYFPSSSKFYIEDAKNKAAQATVPGAGAGGAGAGAGAASTAAKPFSTTHSVIPTPFNEVFEKLSFHIKEQINNHVSSSIHQRLSAINNFFNRNNLFKLSFFMHIYKFDHTKVLDIETTNEKKKRLSQIFNDLQINIHKSAVVANAGNVSAKINDHSKTQHKFKIINNSNNTGKINKLKIVSGNPLLVAEDNFADILHEFQKIDTGHKPSSLMAPLLRLLSRVKYNTEGYNELFREWEAYLSSPYERSWEHGHFFTYHDYIKLANAINAIQKYSYNIAGAKVTFEFDGYDFIKVARTMNLSLPIPSLMVLGFVEQPSSYFSLVSTEYARQNDIEPISESQYQEFKQLVNNKYLTQEEWEKEYYKFIIDKNNQNSVVNINEKKLIVVGIAQTPDFLFPTHSWLNIIPDKEKEGLVYVDQFAFESLTQDSIVQFFENYLSFRFPPIVDKLGLKTRYIQQLKDFTKTFIGDNDVSISLASDNRGEKSLSSVRENYVESFSKTIYLIVWALLGNILGISLVVIFVLIKKYLQKNMNVFGAFMANGTPKLYIILGASVYILIPVICAGVLGYALSLITQPIWYSFISNMWFLPTSYSSFSIVKLINFLIKIVAVIMPVFVLAATWVLRPKVSVLLKENALFKQSRLTHKIYTWLSKTTALWKFRFIIIFNAINQTIMLTSASIVVYMLFNFSFHTAGKIKEVARAELDTQLHGYELDYTTATEQAGQYFLKSYFDLGRTFSNNISQDINVVYNQNKRASITLGPDNPELVAANLFSPYHAQDLGPYSECLQYLFSKHQNNAGAALQEFNKDVLKFTPNALYKFFENKQSDHYLSRHYVSKKTPTPPASADTTTSNKCQSIATDYESKYGEIVPLKTAKIQLFHKSATTADTQEKNTASTSGSGLGAAAGTGTITKTPKPWIPKTYIGQKYNMATYLPVDKEDWKSTKSGLVNTSDYPSMEMYGEEPLFKALHDFYNPKNTDSGYQIPFNKFLGDADTTKTDKPRSWYLTELDKISAKADTDSIWKDSSASTTSDAKSSSSSSSSSSKTTPSLELSEDFWEYKDNKNNTWYLPTLSRLHKDNGNYLTINMNDFMNIQKDPSMFKNRVFTRLLLDHTFEITGNLSTQHFNIWRVIEDQVKALHPELALKINKNHQNFIDRIISSKYGSFFINRFMTKHAMSGGTTDQESLTHTIKSHKSGELFDKKHSYAVYADKLDDKFKNSIEQGLYYIDVLKVFYFYNSLDNININPTAAAAPAAPTVKDPNESKHANQYVVYRPDFLYLFYALMNDKSILTDEHTAPIKFAFNYSVYYPDYEKFNKNFSVSGDPTKDGQLKLGLTSSDGSDKYQDVPNGDQTYTWVDASATDAHGQHQTLKITGLKQDHRGAFLRLLKDGDVINGKLYKEGSTDTFPIVINKFAAKKFGLSEGSTIKIKVHNHYKRFTAKFSDINLPRTYTLKVAGIYDSYFSNKFFISQKNANIILGLSPDYGFNGILTKQFTGSQEPIQFNSGISTYAKSGIFTNTSMSKNSTSLQKLFESEATLKSDWDWLKPTDALKTGSNYQTFKALYGVKADNVVDVAKTFIDVFGASKNSQGTLLHNVSNNGVVNNVYFDTIGNLIIQITYLFAGFLTPILVLSLSVITHLIIDDLKNLLVILKLLGFSIKENSVPIVLYLSAIWVWTAIFGSILFIIGINFYVDVVFTGLKILMPISLQMKHFALSLSLLAGILGLIIAKSYVNIKGIYMPTAMKLLTD